MVTIMITGCVVITLRKLVPVRRYLVSYPQRVPSSSMQEERVTVPLQVVPGRVPSEGAQETRWVPNKHRVGACMLPAV